MFEIEPVPYAREEIAATLAGVERATGELVGGMTDEEFFAPQGDYWSPAGHIRHLAKSVRAVAQGMAMPKVALLAFGVSRGGSRTFEEIRGVYRDALAAGGQAGGYGPSADEPERELIESRWRDAQRQLESAVSDWSEKSLDRYRLPHPLIGKLTVREMLFFTAYHNAHHARRIVERRAPS